MNCLRFLEKLKEVGKSAIFVIAMIGSEDNETEKKALQAGTIDFERKPINKDILLSHTENALIRNQVVLLQHMEYIAFHDSLTKLNNQNKMVAKTRRMLDNNTNIQFVVAYFDIDKFRLCNTTMGE